MDPIEALRIRGIGVGKKLVGDAQVGDVRAGKTFSNAQGNDKAGTLPVRSLVAQTVTPGVNNIIKQAGIYDGDITIQGDANLVGANIISGKNIFGVAGTFVGKKTASGTYTTDTSGMVIASGLSFQPSVIILYKTTIADNLCVYDSSASTTNYSRNGGLSAVNTGGGYVNSSGFSLSVALSSTLFHWHCYE